MSKFNKSGNPKGRHKSHGHSSSYNMGAQSKEVLEKLNEDCPIVQNFKLYAKELDKRHDKFERLVKLSRDITIESKRIIFLLHSIDRESKKVSALSEAQKRIESLISVQWRSVAIELQNEDPYLFHRAFSPGMQEFMEAFIFFNFLNDKKFLHWDEYQIKLKYKAARHTIQNSQIDENLSKFGDTPLTKEENEIMAIVVPVDYILGLADVTGELMRKCINNLVEGDVQGCFFTCDIVRNLYSGFLSIGLFGNKEMSRKVFTLRQSLLKMELVCYNIHVRGTEVPGYILADVNPQKTFTESDEGFFD